MPPKDEVAHVIRVLRESAQIARSLSERVSPEQAAANEANCVRLDHVADWLCGVIGVVREDPGGTIIYVED